MMERETAPKPEVSWFAALCDDDYEFLGVSDPALASSYDHCRDIVLRAERAGFDNVLLPSGYQLGIDAVAFAAAVAPELERMRLLVAIRCGELWPPQLARQLATLDQVLRGRLTINIISSDIPGAPLASEPRYARTLEVMQILRELLEGRAVDHRWEFFQLDLVPEWVFDLPPTFDQPKGLQNADVAADLHAGITGFNLAIRHSVDCSTF